MSSYNYPLVLNTQNTDLAHQMTVARMMRSQIRSSERFQMKKTTSSECARET